MNLDFDAPARARNSCWSIAGISATLCAISAAEGDAAAAGGFGLAVVMTLVCKQLLTPQGRAEVLAFFAPRPRRRNGKRP